MGTVFYIWQSDLDKKGNRFLIRDSLVDAIDQLNMSSKEPLSLDHDTKDVSGTPPITETILRKIETCSVVVADLSIVGKGFDDGKSLPNPNVMFELGYAAAKIGWERVICVMNSAYGEPEALPIDLRARRWPIRYDLPKNAVGDGPGRKRTQTELSKELEHAIPLSLDHVHARAKETRGRMNDECLELARANGSSEFFHLPKDVTMRDVMSNQGSRRAVIRLLDLGLLWCDVEGDNYAYHWTDMGKLILRDLGIR